MAQHLALFGAALLLPALILIAATLLSLASSERQRRAADLLDSARQTAAIIDRELAGILGALQVLATSPAAVGRDYAALVEQARRLEPSLGARIAIDDTATAATGASSGGATPGGLAGTGAARQPHISGLVADPSGSGAVRITAPVLAGGEVVMLISAVLSPERLRAILIRPDDFSEGTTLIGGDGIVIARWLHHEKFVGKPIPPASMAGLVGTEGFMQGTNLEGRPNIVAYKQVPLSGWWVGAGLERATLEAPLRRTLRQLSLLAAALAALAGLGSWLLGRRLSEPTGRLAAAARAVGRGEIVAPARAHVRELDEVGATLAAVSSDLRARTCARDLAEAQQKVLVRELQHRVKNVLATVQAIASSSARSATDLEAFQQAFGQRLASLGRTHELLTGSGWQSADLGDLARLELAPYLGPDTRIRLEGPKVELPVTHAIAIGMALHELTTNAAKYGALSAPGGVVAVVWTVRRDAGRVHLELSWREQGGPPATPPTRKGFGTQLLDLVLAQQLEAEVERDFAPEGLRVTVRCSWPDGNVSAP